MFVIVLNFSKKQLCYVLKLKNIRTTLSAIQCPPGWENVHVETKLNQVVFQKALHCLNGFHNISSFMLRNLVCIHLPCTV